MLVVPGPYISIKNWLKLGNPMAQAREQGDKSPAAESGLKGELGH